MAKYYLTNMMAAGGQAQQVPCRFTAAAAAAVRDDPDGANII